MKLHKYKESFIELINIVSDYYKIDPSLVEKDYFVTLILSELVNRVPNLLFKGGTSLSKCYKIIERFSEDIDLTLGENFHTPSQKKLLKNELLNTFDSLEMTLLNGDNIRSRRDYNRYDVEYPIQYFNNTIKPILLVETTFITKSYPSEILLATSYIYDYLKEVNNEKIIEKYELFPFEIKVQRIDRTFIDKVFAICDYAISNRIERNSRHIYDLYMILKKINIDENLKTLVREVREDRKKNNLCYSAQDNMDIPKILMEIIEKDIYKKDYESITKAMMFKYIPYSEVINVLRIIIESGLFENI